MNHGTPYKSVHSLGRQPDLELDCSSGPWSLVQSKLLFLSLVYRGLLGHANSYPGLHWLSQDGEGLLLKRILCSGQRLTKVPWMGLFVSDLTKSGERAGVAAGDVVLFLFPTQRGSGGLGGSFPTLGLGGLCRVLGEWGPCSPPPMPSLCP